MKVGNMQKTFFIIGDAAPGTIRGDFATAPDGDMIPNIVHGSDSEESAAREIKIWFGE